MKHFLVFVYIIVLTSYAHSQCKIPKQAIFDCGTQEEAFLSDFALSLNDENMSEEMPLTLNQGTSYRFRVCYVSAQGEKLTMSLLNHKGEIIASKQFSETEKIHFDYTPNETANYVFIINVQNPTRKKVCVAAALFYL